MASALYLSTRNCQLQPLVLEQADVAPVYKHLRGEDQATAQYCAAGPPDSSSANNQSCRQPGRGPRPPPPDFHPPLAQDQNRPHVGRRFLLPARRAHYKDVFRSRSYLNGLGGSRLSYHSLFFDFSLLVFVVLFFISAFDRCPFFLAFLAFIFIFSLIFTANQVNQRFPVN